MIDCGGKKVQKFEITDIDFTDKFFKISKNVIDDALLKSIKKSGLLNPPILLENKKNNNYQVLFGFNRLQVLKDLKVRSVDVVLIDNINFEEYVNYILIKNYNNEIGPIGKLRIIKILHDFFKCDYDQISILTKNSLNIPGEIIKHDFIKKIFTFSENLINYIDYKDINFKIILKLLKLPDEILVMLSSYIDNVNFKINIFKKALDLLSDLVKDHKFVEKFNDFDWDDLDDKTSREEFLLSKLNEIRYPEYSSDINKVGKIVTSFKKNQIEIDFPKFFEDDKIVLKINIRKKDDVDNIINRIENMDKESIKRLLELL